MTLLTGLGMMGVAKFLASGETQMGLAIAGFGLVGWAVKDPTALWSGFMEKRRASMVPPPPTPDPINVPVEDAGEDLEQTPTGRKP